MTHDYQRNGTTTLFAALDVLTGTVIGQCLPRHRHIEFLTFLKDDRPRGPQASEGASDPRQLRHPQPPQGHTAAAVDGILHLAAGSPGIAEVAVDPVGECWS